MARSIRGSGGTSHSVQGQSAISAAKGSFFAAESDDRNASEESLQPLPDAESLDWDRRCRTALVVVDQPNLVNVIVEALDRLEVRVSLESQADRALQAIAVQRFDLVLVDVDLQPDGWQVVQAIRSRLPVLPCPLILLVAPDAVIDDRRQGRADQSVCLRKPIAADDLERAAAGVLGDRRLHRQAGRPEGQLEGCSDARSDHARIEPEGAENAASSLKTGC